MSSFPPRKSAAWLQAFLVMALAWAGVALLFGRTGWSDWSSPRWLEGDPLEVYARVKIAAEQPGHALASFTRIERLGAPGVADWSAYPVPDRFVFVLTGLLARAAGLIAAVNLMAALITGLNAASFYLCARWLRWRWEWAAALALAFAFCNHNVRWGITLSLGQTFTLPPLVLLCAWAARRSHPAGGNRSWQLLAAGLGLWLGIGNPYLAYFAGVVASGALALAWWRRSPGTRKAPLFLFLCCLLGSFLVSNAAYLGPRLRGATPEVLPRSPEDLRIYALRPADWLVPPADHRVPAMAALGRDYLDARHGQGEFFYNYLGLPGVAGLILLLGTGLRRALRRRWRQTDAVLGLAWITVFGVHGGLNTWLGTAGLELFRASTRIGIFAHVWVLFFLGGWISRRTPRQLRIASIMLASGLAIVVNWEQTPPLAKQTPVPSPWFDVPMLTRVLEKVPGGMVFQLPVVPFPEAGRTGNMPDYEHFLPFLASKSLRFSYGHLRQSPALQWAQHVSRLPVPDMVAALEQAGFSAIWIDSRAYPDGGNALALKLWKLRGAPIERRTAWIFGLTPSTQPQLPDFDDPRLNEAWDDSAASAGVYALEGWFPPEHDDRNRWRWAGRQARLGCWRDGPAATLLLRCRVGGPANSIVVLRQDDREVWRGAPGPNLIEVPLLLSAGFNVLDWTLEGRTFRPGDHDPRELGFMVENLSLSVP